MFCLKDYFIPIDLLTYVILKHISYFELDSVLPCFRLTPKEIALIKYKIYKFRLTVTKTMYDTKYSIEGKLHREDGPAVEYSSGSTEWYFNGLLHREYDLPAIEYIEIIKKWYMHDKLHRIGGPAIERANGDKEWYIQGMLHRSDGPAVEWTTGYRAWYNHNELHNTCGPAVTRSNGTLEWWIHGKQHRDGDLPAVESLNGHKEWWINGARHRDNGLPAVIHKDGRKEYWVDDTHILSS
jgi:hypothetical protein